MELYICKYINIGYTYNLTYMQYNVTYTYVNMYAKYMYPNMSKFIVSI